MSKKLLLGWVCHCEHADTVCDRICRSDIDEDISDTSNEMPAWVELNDFEIGTRFCFDSPYTLLQQAMAQTHWTTLRHDFAGCGVLFDS